MTECEKHSCVSCLSLFQSRMHEIKTADEHSIQPNKLQCPRNVRLHSSVFVLSLTAVIAPLTTVWADGPTLFFHYLPNSNPPCTQGAGGGGDIGWGVLNVHVLAPPPAYTYYAFEAYDPNGVHTGQINCKWTPQVRFLTEIRSMSLTALSLHFRQQSRRGHGHS